MKMNFDQLIVTDRQQAVSLEMLGEIFAFPSLLPMIPGVYAYKTILALMQFMQENQDAAVMNRLIVDICKNGITAFFIIFSLVIGVAIPMLMFKRLSYTRIIKPGH